MKTNGSTHSRFLEKATLGPAVLGVFGNQLSPCWLWTASLDKAGYGRFRWNGRPGFAHRYSWQYANPERTLLPTEQLDHLCRVHNCVNPDHLEPVTNRENQMRGNTVSAKHAAATHCPVGHPYDEGNTYINPHTEGRVCRICMRDRERKRIKDMTPEEYQAHLAHRRARYAAGKLRKAGL